MKYLLLYFILLFQYQLGFSQSEKPDFPDGTCWERTMIPPRPIEKEIVFAVPIGEMPEEAVIDTIEFVIRQAGTRWEKKMDKKTNTKKWCLVEVAEEVATIYQVDTTTTDQYDFEYYNFIEPSDEKAIMEWREVICEAFISNVFIQNLKTVLIENGCLDKNESTKGIDQHVRRALSDYQKRFYLPLGNLNLETLEHMEIY